MDQGKKFVESLKILWGCIHFVLPLLTGCFSTDGGFVRNSVNFDASSLLSRLARGLARINRLQSSPGNLRAHSPPGSQQPDSDRGGRNSFPACDLPGCESLHLLLQEGTIVRAAETENAAHVDRGQTRVRRPQFLKDFIARLLPADAAISVQGNRIYPSHDHVLVSQLAVFLPSLGPSGLCDFLRSISANTSRNQKADGVNKSSLIRFSISVSGHLDSRLAVAA
jgi:hypothetical protein